MQPIQQKGKLSKVSKASSSLRLDWVEQHPGVSYGCWTKELPSAGVSEPGADDGLVIPCKVHTLLQEVSVHAFPARESILEDFRT